MCAFPGPVYSVDLIALHDRYWHKADMLNVLTNVSLRGKADGDQPLLTNLDLRVMFKPNTEQRVVAFDFFETPRDVLRQPEQLVARKNFLQAIGSSRTEELVVQVQISAWVPRCWHNTTALRCFSSTHGSSPVPAMYSRWEATWRRTEPRATTDANREMSALGHEQT